MDEDWDNLLILDACRYDMFEEMCTIEGDLQHRRSKGSATREFAQNNFAGQEYFDTVYVNGNPNVSLFAEGVFHHMDDVWRTDWDHGRGTVMPEVMARHTREAATEFPDKRLVAHFMQPHHPFIGPTATQEFSNLGGNKGARREALSNSDSLDTTGGVESHVWDRVEDGETALEVVRRAYYETLQEALPHIATLCAKLPGKTVVTSDHGNLLGEDAHPHLPWKTQQFAHPDYATATELVTVPWLVCKSESRRTTTSEPPQRRRTAYDEESLNEKLETLGYK